MQYFIKAPCSSGGTCPKDLICLTKMYRLNKVCRFLWRHLHKGVLVLKVLKHNMGLADMAFSEHSCHKQQVFDSSTRSEGFLHLYIKQNSLQT